MKTCKVLLLFQHNESCHLANHFWHSKIFSLHNRFSLRFKFFVFRALSNISNRDFKHFPYFINILRYVFTLICWLYKSKNIFNTNFHSNLIYSFFIDSASVHFCLCTTSSMVSYLKWRCLIKVSVLRCIHSDCNSRYQLSRFVLHIPIYNVLQRSVKGSRCVSPGWRNSCEWEQVLHALIQTRNQRNLLSTWFKSSLPRIACANHSHRVSRRSWSGYKDCKWDLVKDREATSRRSRIEGLHTSKE